MKKILNFIALFFTFFCFTTNAHGINNYITNEVDYININKDLQKIQDTLTKKDVLVIDTIGYIKTLNTIRDKVADVNDKLKIQIKFVEKKIDALGEAPSDNKEDRVIFSKRKNFLKEENSIKIKIAEGDLILAKIDELEKIILTIRNKKLLNSVFNRQVSFVLPKNFINGAKAFNKFASDIITSPINWYNNLNTENKIIFKNNFTKIFLLAIVLLSITTMLSLFVKKYFYHKKFNKTLDYGKKFFIAFITLITYTLIPLSTFSVFFIWFRNYNIIKDKTTIFIINKTLLYLLYIFISEIIINIIFSPKNDVYRLINIDNIRAKHVSLSLSISVILIFTIEFFEKIASKYKYPVELIVYIKFLSCMIKVFCIIFITNNIFKNTTKLNNNQSEDEINNNSEYNNIEDSQYNNSYWELTKNDKVKLFVYIFTIIIFIISLFGFINLSDYILERSILSVIIYSVAYIFSNIIQVLFHKMLLLSFWTKTLKIKKKNLWKLDVWFEAIINPLIIVFTIFILLTIWGVSTDVLLQKIKIFLTEFSIGGIKISIKSIFIGILVYIISMFVFRVIRIKFLANTLEKMKVNYSVRNSLYSGFSFIGFIFSIFFAIVVMGGNLNNLALVAGALSFGVGLGLQNIVNNFISGIMILFEKPIRIGDIVNIGGQEGVVKQINIRSTELETWTKSSVIIPNANVMSNILVNMTHNNAQTRIDLKIIVSTENDPENVMKILIDTANNNKEVLKDPSPFVSFDNFSGSILEFTLKCYIQDISKKQSTINKLRVSILNKFKEYNVKMYISKIYDDLLLIKD